MRSACWCCACSAKLSNRKKIKTEHPRKDFCPAGGSFAVPASWQPWIYARGFNWRRVVDANSFTISSCVGVNGTREADFARYSAANWRRPLYCSRATVAVSNYWGCLVQCRACCKSLDHSGLLYVVVAVELSKFARNCNFANGYTLRAGC
jgi:hypothetical protein